MAKEPRYKRNHYIVNQRFQWRYTWYLLSTIVMATIFTGGVTAYFLNQNYGIFTRLAFVHAPELLPQLEREQVWINTFLVAFFITIISFNLLYGLKMTARIAGPIMVIKKYIRSLTSGMFFVPGLRVRDKDEFQDLVEAFNYLYRSLQAQLRRDVGLIQKAIDELDNANGFDRSNTNLEASRAHLVKLLSEKREQLDEPTPKIADKLPLSTTDRIA